MIDFFLYFLDQANDISHTQYARRDPIRMERFQCCHFLTGTDKLDRLASNHTHRQRGTTTRIAISFGQHDTG